MAVKYRIQCMSSERGWGQEYWHEDFDTFEAAKRRIFEINSKLSETVVPDYYEKANQNIEAVEVFMSPQGYVSKK